jgi:hypothetical protein
VEHAAYEEAVYYSPKERSYTLITTEGLWSLTAHMRVSNPPPDAVELGPVAELRAALDEEIARRTLGGTPPPSDENWANQALPPPESATTGPVAPPGMRRSDDHLRGK